MNKLYLDAVTTGTTPATALDSQAGANADRVLKLILVGKPTAGATITVYDINNALSNNTTNIAYKYTYPTFGAGIPASDKLDLTATGEGSSKRNGLPLNSGSVVTSSAMQVTFLYEDPDA